MTTNSQLDQALLKYINYPRNGEACFDLATAYVKAEQISAAITFFVKCAELSNKKSLQYEALLQAGTLIRSLGGRDNISKGIFRHAIALCPTRSEGYYFLSVTCEALSQWHEMYMYASIGLELTDPEDSARIPDWPGKSGLLFQKAVAAWWIDRPEESIATMRKVLTSSISENYKQVARSNVANLAPLLRPVNNRFVKEFKHSLKIQFSRCEEIEHNFSEAYQDLFVLMCTNGKENGTFVEIGAAHPEYHSNTALLEKNYNWTGVSVDINPNMFRDWKGRTATTVIGDAQTLDWSNLLNRKHYDYLQIDCEPSLTSLQALLNIPLNQITFSVITFEHDRYVDSSDFVVERSREYLKGAGYVLVIPNVSTEETKPFEDWWVHPSYVSSKVINLLARPDYEINVAQDCVLNF